MLPKPEKSKKIPNLSDKDDNSTESEAEISQKRLLLKRRLILISLLMTAGLSFIFWSFRATQKFINQPLRFNFKLPRLNLPQKSNSNISINSDIFTVSSSQSDWSIISLTKSNPNSPIFSHNYHNFNFDQTLASLSSLKPSLSSLIDTNLPQGLSFKEKITTDSGLTYQTLISLPTNTLLISIFIPRVDNLDSIKPQLSDLVNSLYWYSVKHLN
ncbi:MAG TPA: hypothetical protein PKZ92_01610 [Candidatus Woesebacteria bacterium]|jgi:hypothetical protein|nr:hypothetical protein [Candidatus Shapirobacteria bacterium]HOR01935.1 hypothetical protein [Candidatus Woesebacteria bacterium]